MREAGWDELKSWFLCSFQWVDRQWYSWRNLLEHSQLLSLIQPSHQMLEWVEKLPTEQASRGKSSGFQATAQSPGVTSQSNCLVALCYSSISVSRPFCPTLNPSLPFHLAQSHRPPHIFIIYSCFSCSVLGVFLRGWGESVVSFTRDSI